MKKHRSFPKPGKEKPRGKKPAAGPSRPKKFKPVNEGLGTVFATLTEPELRERAMQLATALHQREEEVEAQASTRSAMKARLDEFDQKIHRLQTSIREKREERPAPGLFDKLDAHKEKPVAKDTMTREQAIAALPVPTAGEKVAAARAEVGVKP